MLFCPYVAVRVSRADVTDVETGLRSGQSTVRIADFVFQQKGPK